MVFYFYTASINSIRCPIRTRVSLDGLLQLILVYNVGYEERTIHAGSRVALIEEDDCVCVGGAVAHGPDCLSRRPRWTQ